MKNFLVQTSVFSCAAVLIHFLSSRNEEKNIIFSFLCVCSVTKKDREGKEIINSLIFSRYIIEAYNPTRNNISICLSELLRLSVY